VLFLECLSFDLGEGRGAEDKEGEEVAIVSAFYVGYSLGILVCDFHLI